MISARCTSRLGGRAFWGIVGAALVRLTVIRNGVDRRNCPDMRQAWELDDADKAEKLLRNLAQRLERDWSGVSGSILEGIDEILTVTRLRLPKELRRSLACTNIIENVMSVPTSSRT